MTPPTVHLNGSSADTLLEGYEAAAESLGAALEALAGAAPNARDYYVQGPSAFEEARREHVARLEKVTAVLEEIRLLHRAVYRQKDARKRT